MRFPSLVRVFAKLTLACSCALIMLTAHSASEKAPLAVTKKQAPHRAIMTIATSKEARIARIVEISQPGRGKRYAQRVARAIVHSARHWNVDPLLVAAIGYKESEFSMSSGPCVGVMQVYPPTYREMCQGEARAERVARKKGQTIARPRALRDADIYDLEGNIEAGAAEIATYLRRYSGNKYRALGRYNGCGANGRYVTLVMRTYGRFQNWSVERMARQVKENRMLWSSA